MEESSETLATANPADAFCRRRIVDEFVAEALVMPLAVVVLHELV
jgi:hypothetical protein